MKHLTAILLITMSAIASAQDVAKPVRVFVLAGQSNMEGAGLIKADPKRNGGQGSLEFLVKDAATAKHFAPLVDSAGQWRTRDDVWISYLDRKGPLTIGYGARPAETIGPELGFGHVMGHVHDEPVLLLKACIGNRSLGWDLLPPGSEQFEFEGKTYAGYKDIANFWDKGTEPKPVPWYVGRQYDADVAHSQAVLKNLEMYFPGDKGQGYVVAGFVWWQGHKDQNAALAGRYEQNLVHLIKTLHKDFNSPNAKFVLATGCGNPGREGFGLQIAEAQLAVDGDKGKYPEFKGNVDAIDARPFWREAEVSPSNQSHHYNHNAETYYEVGDALGWAMAELLKASN